MNTKKYMWEVLIPTVQPNTDGKKFFTTRYHRAWDAKVRKITHGLTILPPNKGQWISPEGTLFVERMIPVRVMATHDSINKIIDMTIDYYLQEAVMFYKVSDEVMIRQHPTRKNRS